MTHTFPPEKHAGLSMQLRAVEPWLAIKVARSKTAAASHALGRLLIGCHETTWTLLTCYTGKQLRQAAVKPDTGNRMVEHVLCHHLIYGPGIHEAFLKTALPCMTNAYALIKRPEIYQTFLARCKH